MSGQLPPPVGFSGSMVILLRACHSCARADAPFTVHVPPGYATTHPIVTLNPICDDCEATKTAN